MKKNFFYGALAVLTLAACSQEDVLNENQDGNEIKFSVVTNKASRAADLWDNEKKPGTFTVWANLNDDGRAYFAGDVLTLADGEWTSPEVRYWPDGGVDFFAVAGRSDNSLAVTPAQGDNATSAAFDYTVKAAVAEQEDVLYAAAINKNKNENNTAEKVTLNFGHALSQIVFKAYNSNTANLHVVVSGVKVAHLNNAGTFTFSSDTGSQFNETEVGEYTANNTNVAGIWSDLTGDATYEIATSDDVVLTSSAQDLAGTQTEMLLMPQSKNAWTSDAGGTFFAVKCQIYNVAGDEYDPETDVCLWGEEKAEYVFIPAAITWSPGKKYIYTFHFGEGNGGFEPDPEDPNNPDPDTPVLVPIEYTITVDDFDIVSDATVDVDGKKE